MKIGIVTIYKCYNYGSFYQAYGLQRYLESLGHDVSFLDLDTKFNRRYRLRKQFSRDIKRDFFSLKLVFNYIKDWNLYCIKPKDSVKYDLIIIGSDEIWNIHNGSFTCLPEYYGLDLPCNTIITYASCVGRSDLESFANRAELIDGIKNIDAVSVRDDNTEAFVSEIRPNGNAIRVLDPSFLVNWKEVEKPCNYKDFILVYTYDGNWGFSEDYINKTKEFAKATELPLVSVGFRNIWCDKWIACSPREFLGYLRNATYVVTDTFHGTAMSIQYQKEFISLGKGKQKVESLLKELNLFSRLYQDQSDFSHLFAKPIDYSEVNKQIDIKKERSEKFLKKYLR